MKKKTNKQTLLMALLAAIGPITALTIQAHNEQQASQPTEQTSASFTAQSSNRYDQHILAGNRRFKDLMNDALNLFTLVMCTGQHNYNQTYR